MTFCKNKLFNKKQLLEVIRTKQTKSTTCVSGL